MIQEHRLIELPVRADARGSLLFGQEPDHVPFAVKRFFALYSVPEGSSRGGHAHREQHQFLIMLQGGCTIALDNGRDRKTLQLCKPTQGLYAPPGTWLDLSAFSAQAICLVLTSDIYRESDYIRDYAAFRQWTAENQ